MEKNSNFIEISLLNGNEMKVKYESIIKVRYLLWNCWNEERKKPAVEIKFDNGHEIILVETIDIENAKEVYNLF